MSPGSTDAPTHLLAVFDSISLLSPETYCRLFCSKLFKENLRQVVATQTHVYFICTTLQVRPSACKKWGCGGVWGG